jgi:hypothetical protein
MAKDVLDDVKLSDSQKNVAKKIYDTAVDMGVDPELALATAWTENKFTDKKSPAGAIGIMQIMPATAKSYGVDLKHLGHPDVNIGLGIRILKDNLERHNGDKTLALIDYNAGPKASERFLKANKNTKVLPKETQGYLQKISEHHDLSGQTVNGEEPSPFDNLFPQEDNSPSPFGETQPAPSHLSAEPAPEETSLLEDVAGAAFRAPGVVLPTMGAAYPAAKGQEYLNKSVTPEQMPKAPPTVQDIEAEFMAKQAEKSAGDKWSQKVVGGMGPGGESVTEAARGYQIQKGLEKEGLAPKWRPTREGVILPTPVAQEQQQAEQARLDLEKQAAIDEAIKRQSPLNRLGISTGKFMTTSPAVTGLFQAPAGYFANEARERAQRGDILGSAISSVKAVGAEIGGLPMSPRYKPLMAIKGAGQGAALLGMGADYLRRKLGYDPEYKPYKK